MTHFFDNAPQGPTSPGLDLGNYAKFREAVTFRGNRSALMCKKLHLQVRAGTRKPRKLARWRG
jgi:hypothetical protein